MFRNTSEVRNRLNAYYKRINGIAVIPASNMNDESLTYRLDIDNQDEFLINKFRLINSFELFATTRKLIIIKEDQQRDLLYESITAVYLQFPFKKDLTPHELSVVMESKVIYKIDFLTLSDLVKAREEIYKIISTALIDWRGVGFVVSDNLKDFKEIRLLDLLSP